MPRRPRANSRRLAATKFPLKHLKSESKAAARMMLTIQRSNRPRCWNATAVMNFSPVDLTPGSDECDGRNDACVEKNADEDRHPDGAEKSARAKLRAGFLRGFADRFKSGHEIRDDLNHQQNRDPRSVGEQRLEIRGRTAAHAESDEDDEERECAEAGPVLKRRAEPDAAIVQDGEQRGESRVR